MLVGAQPTGFHASKDGSQMVLVADFETTPAIPFCGWMLSVVGLQNEDSCHDCEVSCTLHCKLAPKKWLPLFAICDNSNTIELFMCGCTGDCMKIEPNVSTRAESKQRSKFFKCPLSLCDSQMRTHMQREWANIKFSCG